MASQVCRVGDSNTKLTALATMVTESPKMSWRLVGLCGRNSITGIPGRGSTLCGQGTPRTDREGVKARRVYVV